MMEIGLGAFIKFANATPRARPRLARQIAEQSRNDYDPATDFWRPMRQAINRDRKTTRDGEALRQVAQAAPDRRRTSFEEISVRWGGVAPRWNGAGHIPSHAARIEIGGLQVRVNPLFSEQWTDGHAESAYVWFNKEELRDDTLAGVRHLLTRDGHEANLVPIFIDVRRTLAAPAAPIAGTDDWLDDLGTEFRGLAA
jgi:hypothetical protein